MRTGRRRLTSSSTTSRLRHDISCVRCHLDLRVMITHLAFTAACAAHQHAHAHTHVCMLEFVCLEKRPVLHVRRYVWLPIMCCCCCCLCSVDVMPHGMRMRTYACDRHTLRMILRIVVAHVSMSHVWLVLLWLQMSTATHDVDGSTLQATLHEDEQQHHTPTCTYHHTRHG